MLIREAKKKDFSAICNLITCEDEMFLVYPSGTWPFTVEQVQALAAERIELTVVQDGDDITGFANLYDHVPGRYAFIGNVVVIPACRGRGLGRQLVEHMLQQARLRYQLPEVRISVFSENTRAMLLYTSLGFAPYNIEQRCNPRGRKVALVHMKKLMSS